MNKYKLIATDKSSDKPNEYKFIYYFETLEQAQHAKSMIEKGGNRAKINKVKGGQAMTTIHNIRLACGIAR